MKKIIAIFLTILIFIVIGSTFVVSAQAINSPIATYPTETKNIQKESSIVVDNGAISPSTGDNILWMIIGSLVVSLICLIILIITIWFIYKKMRV